MRSQIYVGSVEWQVDNYEVETHSESLLLQMNNEYYFISNLNKLTNVIEFDSLHYIYNLK
jgi:hypothetical protein